jgi:hypothetical protein
VITPGLQKLNLRCNAELEALPAGLWSLAGLRELDLHDCGLRTLPEEIGGLVGLRALSLGYNKELGSSTATLPAALWSLAGLEELSLQWCGLRSLPEGIGLLAGLKTLDLSLNRGLASLPAGLCSLVLLDELSLYGCGLTALPAVCHSWTGPNGTTEPRVSTGNPYLIRGLGAAHDSCQPCAPYIVEGVGALAGLRGLDLRWNTELAALPVTPPPAPLSPWPSPGRVKPTSFHQTWL